MENQDPHANLYTLQPNGQQTKSTINRDSSSQLFYKQEMTPNYDESNRSGFR